MSQNTNTTNKSTTAAKAAPTPVEMPEAVAAAVDLFTAKEPLPCSFESLSVSEYLDGDTTAPIYQRPYVWKPTQADALIDSLLNGYPIPPIIIADITENGKTLSLLIDGVQRTTTLREYIDGVNVADDVESAKLDAVLSAPVNVMRVACNSAASAAELFVRYNSGSSLNGIQRTKANLPEHILVPLNAYIKWAQAFGLAKMGKVTPDTAAMMIAAAIVDRDKSTSSGASAGKVLASAKELPVMPLAMAIVQDAIMLADADALDYWTSPARLVPLVMAVNDTDCDNLTAETLSAFMTAFNPADRSAYQVVTVKKGRGKDAKPVTSKKQMTVSAAMADTGNGHGATHARYCILKGAVETAHKPAKPSTAEAVAAVIEGAMA